MMKRLLLVLVLILALLTGCGQEPLSGVVSYDIQDTSGWSKDILKSAANDETLLTAQGTDEEISYQWFLLGREIDDTNEWPLYVNITEQEDGWLISYEYAANDALLQITLPLQEEKLALYSTDGEYLTEVIQKNTADSTLVYCPTDSDNFSGQSVLKKAPEIAIEANSCRLSVECVDIYNHLSDFDLAKLSVLPHDGWILETEDYEIQEGESAYSLLKRILKEEDIPMESVASSYGGYYIEGIANIYQMDAGGYSGWLYSVNGESPQVGADSYQLQAGDEVCFYYQCTFE